MSKRICPSCDGEREVEHPHLTGGYVSIVAECPADPVMVECEDCGGTGEVEDEE